MTQKSTRSGRNGKSHGVKAATARAARPATAHGAKTGVGDRSGAVAKSGTKSSAEAKSDAAAKPTHAKKAAAPAAPPAKRRRGRPTRQEAQQRDAEYAQFEGDRLIHRYGNRRFYDLEARRAVTLEEIAELVRRGESVRVLDVDAGNDDITRRVLTQIILEEKSHPTLEMLPIEFLRKLIATQDQKVATWLDGYLKTGTELIDRSLRDGFPLVTNFQKQMADLMRGIVPTKLVNSFDELTKQRSREIDELRRRLDELAKPGK